MMLDRKKQPEFGRIENINLQEPKVVHLENGIPVLCINAGIQNVLKIELVFDAGTATADKRLVASMAVKTLTEGTAKHNAKEIAEAVDFYGAYLQNEVNHDDSSICLYSLNKHLGETLRTLTEVYANPTFPKHELETVLLKSQQEARVNMEKVGYLAAKAFSAALYGETHPYGRSADLDDYTKVQRSDLVNFHSARIKNGIKYILVAGKLGDDTVSNLNKFFGSEERAQPSPVEIDGNGIRPSTIHVNKENAVQNSIKIGRVMFNRTHPDFIGMRVLSTVLGGYFGSRLMTNIREDKGYTYGIGAGMVSMKSSGYFSISTEVGADVCEAALTEIHLEIERLRNSLISSSELELVKNYMLGSILKSIDGPFDVSAKWKGYMKYGFGIDAHYELIHQIKTITPERLKGLANAYLQRKDLVQVTAGAEINS